MPRSASAARILPGVTPKHARQISSKERMMDDYATLAEAIRTRQQVVGRYGGEERVFSPHALGTKRGRNHVLVYQYAGGSQSGLPPGGEWRCLDLAELSQLQLEAGAWRTAANVFNPQSCLDEIEVVVDPLPPRIPAPGATDESV
jgi:hypothetical protein